MPRIAVEQPFTDIQQALKDSGLQVDMLNQKTNVAHYDIIVVRNLESYDDNRFEGSLVEASGRTIYEIVKEVEERLQRAGKIEGEAAAVKNEGNSKFLTGLISGVVMGSAVALLLTPKSGKELQIIFKDKLASSNLNGNEDSKLSQAKEKATDVAKATKEKVSVATTQVKEKISGSTKEDQKTEKETNSSSVEDKKD